MPLIHVKMHYRKGKKVNEYKRTIRSNKHIFTEVYNKLKSNPKLSEESRKRIAGKVKAQHFGYYKGGKPTVNPKKGE